jgi:uncharacterized protein YpiB (UPF0302 family)
MNDLIKEIRQNHKFTREQIIKKIDEDIFLNEKSQFLEIFRDIITITLEDILR